MNLTRNYHLIYIGNKIICLYFKVTNTTYIWKLVNLSCISWWICMKMLFHNNNGSHYPLIHLLFTTLSKTFITFCKNRICSKFHDLVWFEYGSHSIKRLFSNWISFYSLFLCNGGNRYRQLRKSQTEVQLP